MREGDDGTIWPAADWHRVFHPRSATEALYYPYLPGLLITAKFVVKLI